jgi:hypothetical protein
MNIVATQGIQHNGAIPGVSSSIAFFPDLKLGVALLSNSDGKYLVNKEILWKIVDTALEHEGRAQPYVTRALVRISAKIHSGQ